MNSLTWIAMAACLSQSAMMSGLNLAFFSLNKLELQVGARRGDARARRVLALRDDANFVLVTILWGNVAVNVLLALLAESVMTGVAAFLFSTVAITLFAEIAPQAYFSRHALSIASMLSPAFRLYQIVLYPVARPTAMLLDRWLGPEGIRYFRERDLRTLIRLHMDAAESDIARIEGQGALNFLELDDVPLCEEGEEIHPDSILEIAFEGNEPVFPPIGCGTDDEFLRRVHASGKKWVVLVDALDEPRLVIDSDEFIRDALFDPERFTPLRHCHRPIVARRAAATLGELIPRFAVTTSQDQHEVVNEDVMLLWGERKRLVTGGDILGRLLRGISRAEVRAVA